MNCSKSISSNASNTSGAVRVFLFCFCAKLLALQQNRRKVELNVRQSITRVLKRKKTFYAFPSSSRNVLSLALKKFKQSVKMHIFFPKNKKITWLIECFCQKVKLFSFITPLCTSIDPSCVSIKIHIYSCFKKGCPTKPYVTMPKGIMGNGDHGP